MAFRAGIKAPKQFQGQDGKRATSVYDRLVTVTGYDTNKGYVYAKDENGKEYEAFVNPETVRKVNEAVAKKGTDISEVNWMGHSIDDKMEKMNPIGTKIILRQAKFMQNDSTRKMIVTEIDRVVGVPAPEADKTFQGLFTMSYRTSEGKERISRVQSWKIVTVDDNPVGIDINDEKGLADLRLKIDKARENVGQKIGKYGVVEPTFGVQFRALMKTDRKYEFATDPNKTEIYEAVDFSIPFDWIPGPDDENGKEIKSEAHVLTGEEMMGLAEMYVQHVSNHPSFKDHIADMRVEVVPYLVYPASKNDDLLLTRGDPEKDKNADKNPLYQLSHRQSFLDMAHEDYIIGKNAAVKGIIQLSSNKLDKVDGRPVEIPNYWVSRIHVNNTKGHVHSFIRTSDGYKVEPNAALTLVRKDQPENAPKQPSSGDHGHSEAESHAAEAGSSTHASSTFNQNVEDDFDPFKEEPRTAAPSAPAETPEKSVEAAGEKPLRFGVRN